jgi:hypothetical protein
MAGGTKVTKVVAKSTRRGVPQIWLFFTYLINALMGQAYSVFTPISQKKIFIICHLLPFTGCV